LRGFAAHDLPLLRNPASRFSFLRQPAASLLLYVDARCFACTGEAAVLAERLCADEQLTLGPAMIQSEAVLNLIVELYNQGSLAFDVEP
jgi:50S ribosomal protein L16 3-hydroxylase